MNRPIFHYNDQGQLHRTDGPAVEYEDGSKHWCINGQLHRTDGPAIERTNEIKIWYVNDLLHRIDGPAVERINGRKEWYVRGTDITDWIKQTEISDNPTREEQILIMLTWC